MSGMDTFRSKCYLGTDSVYLDRPEFDFMKHAKVGTSVANSLELSSDWITYYSMIAEKHGLNCKKFLGYLVNSYIVSNDLNSFDVKTGDYVVDAGALYNFAKRINGIADQIISLSNSSVDLKPRTMQCTDLGGQDRFKFLKKHSPMISPGRYAIIVRNLVSPADQDSIAGFDCIQSTLGESSNQVLTVVNSHLDELIDIKNPLNTSKDLLKRYADVQDYRVNGINDLLSCAKGEVSVLGNYVESARPCLNFYNCQPSFLSLKFLLDFPEGNMNWKYVRALILGSGTQGKTSLIKANLYNQQEQVKLINYFEKPVISDVDQWLQTDETVGLEFFHLLAFKEMFYKDYLKPDFSIGNEPLDICVTSRIASGMFPKAFGIDVSDCPNPDMAFYPNPKSLQSMYDSWTIYANMASRFTKSINEFKAYFGLSEHEILRKDIAGLSEAISLPKQDVSSCLSRFL